LITVDLNALITFEGGAWIKFEGRLQSSLKNTCQMNGSNWSWTWVQKFVNFTIPTIFEMELQDCNNVLLLGRAHFISLRTRMISRGGNLSCPGYGVSTC
ncbi:hypothetical protein MKW92_020735, partial [Papaver armeniacum]